MSIRNVPDEQLTDAAIERERERRRRTRREQERRQAAQQRRESIAAFFKGLSHQDLDLLAAGHRSVEEVGHGSEDAARWTTLRQLSERFDLGKNQMARQAEAELRRRARERQQPPSLLDRLVGGR